MPTTDVVLLFELVMVDKDVVTRYLVDNVMKLNYSAYSYKALLAL